MPSIETAGPFILTRADCSEQPSLLWSLQVKLLYLSDLGFQCLLANLWSNTTFSQWDFSSPPGLSSYLVWIDDLNYFHCPIFNALLFLPF